MKSIIALLALAHSAMFADTINYTYDAAGRLTGVTYSNGTTIAYTYDKAGNLLSRSVATASAAPGITAGGIVGAAGFQAPLVRGALGGVQVTAGGTAAPLVYVPSSPIDFPIPFAAATSHNTALLSTNGAPSLNVANRNNHGR